MHFPHLWTPIRFLEEFLLHQSLQVSNLEYLREELFDEVFGSFLIFALFSDHVSFLVEDLFELALDALECVPLVE
jgi:hypothetical protein